MLVTGAGGFVGSWLAKGLLDAGASVTVILRDEPGLSNFDLLGLASRANIVRGSITDIAVMERAVNEYEVDTCFHLAAQAIVGAANRAPISTFESNVKGTWVVLEACRTSRLVDRVIVASSDKAYGAQPVLPYTEAMPLLASNPYDASKAAAEMIARSYHAGFGMPLAITRCANIYGGGDLNYSRLIPGTIRSILLGERPIIRSDGTPVRDYVHVDDAVAAYLRLAESLDKPHVAGQAFNFGGNSPISALDLVRLMLEVAEAKGIEPDIQGKGKLAGEIDKQYLDSHLAESVLGWKPKVDMRSGLRRAVTWYRDQLSSVSESSAGVR
ncbi:MAG: GDP-mannose 4,6-dehydratase [Candidatus Dormibacteraceae bacterium]